MLESTKSMTEEKGDHSTDLGLNLKYLTFVGIWPPDNGTKFWKRVVLCIFFFTGLLLQGLVLCCEVIDIATNTEELDEVTDSIFTAVMTFQGLFKQVYMSYRIKHFQNLVACMNSVFYKAHEPFRTYKKSTLKTSRLYTNSITVTVSSACLAASFLYPFIPLTENFSSIKSRTNISDSRLLPYSVWFPLDKNQTPYHEILYTLTTINAIVLAIYITSTDTFIFSLIIHTFSQFDILQFMLKNVTQYSTGHVALKHGKMNKPLSLATKSDKRNQTYIDILEEHTEKTGSNECTILKLQKECPVEQGVELDLQHNLRDCIAQHQKLLRHVLTSSLKSDQVKNEPDFPPPNCLRAILTVYAFL
jgi:hypothetical protein